MDTPRPPFFDVRMRGFRDRAEVADVLQLLDCAHQAAAAAKTVSSEQPAGRVLADPVVSPVDVPGVRPGGDGRFRRPR